MQLFFLLVAVITLLPTATLAIKCLPLDYNATWSFKSINSVAFKKSIESLEPSYREEYCELQTVLEYSRRVVQIRSITNTAESYYLSSGMIWFHIKIFPNRKIGELRTLSIEHDVTTKCSGEDWCDVDILFRHIDWLMRLNYDRLVEFLVPLFVNQETTSGTCSLERYPGIYCPNGVCAGITPPEIVCPSGVCYVETTGTTEAVSCFNDLNKSVGIDAYLNYFIYRYPEPMDPEALVLLLRISSILISCPHIIKSRALIVEQT